jgi:hypothetical protein
MLDLDMHLTEDELLALRERRLDDARLWKHLLGCRECKRRFAFLGAFKSALTDARREFRRPQHILACCSESSSAMDSGSDDSHPNEGLLTSYFHGGLGSRWLRARVHEHVVGCERCMALVVDSARRSPAPNSRPNRDIREVQGVRDVRDIRENRGQSQLDFTCRSSAPRSARPQLVLGLEDGPGTRLRFRVLGGPDAVERPESWRPRLEEQVEVMLKGSRVTIGAHREGESRRLDVEVRGTGRQRSRVSASVSLERDGRAIAETRTDAAGAASLAVPAGDRELDLRIDGGWTIPVLVRLRP